MAFCLLPEQAEEFKKALKSGNVNIQELITMSTAERIEALEPYAGDNVRDVNHLFEQKLVLENRVQGLKEWASKMANVGRYNPNYKEKFNKKLEEYRERQNERLFNPKENEAFLSSLVEQKMGVEITREQAKNIYAMSANIDNIKAENYSEETGWDTEESRYNYGYEMYKRKKYVDTLKLKDMPILGMVKERFAAFKEDAAENLTGAIGALGMDALGQINNNSIAMVASFDNSFLGRQGLKTLIISPSSWFNAAKKSFSDIAYSLGGQDTMATLMADVYSREHYMNGDYIKAGILREGEEEHPESLVERIPVVGRGLKASEAAFVGSAIRMRVDLFDKFYEQLPVDENGQMGDAHLKDLGLIVNSLTAKGAYGKYGESPIVKLALWAPRLMKANWDVWTGHTLGGQLQTTEGRSLARTNILKVISFTALLLLIAKAMLGDDSVEEDPRSADFGKIKANNTRFDISAGAAGLVSLGARLITGTYKSSTTGIVTPYGTGYGEMDRMDVILSFLENKLSPTVRSVVDMLREENFDREKPTLKSTGLSLITPITIQNMIDIDDESDAPEIIGVIADFVGIGANTYQYTANWSNNPGKTLTQFREHVGEEEFLKANEEYNRKFNEWFDRIKKDPRFIELAEEDKKKVLTKKKNDLKDEIFKSYRFKYKREKSKPIPRFN